MKTMIIVSGLAVLLFLATGCVEDNPLNANPDADWHDSSTHPHIVLAGTESTGPGSPSLHDLDPDVNGIQDGIILKFDKAIDPATIISSSFSLLTADSSEVAVQFTSIEYFPENRTALLRATFSEDTAYLLTVKAGAVTDIAGNELDPNHNALYDGAPWDNRVLPFVAGVADMPDVVPPVVNAHFPAGGGQTNRKPEITVVFHQGPMDVSTLTLSNIRLLKTSDSSSVTLELNSATDNHITVTPADSLAYGTRYTVVLSHVVADSSGNSLDSNNDGYVWPDEPDFSWDLQIADDSTTTTTPPTVLLAARSGNLVTIEFVQSLTGNFVVMDESTFTGANIQIADPLGSIPIAFEQASDPNKVYCLLQRTPAGTVTVNVSCYVADEHGNLLDGNNDGLGGTPGEDDWSATL